jgi:hypothetical protein
MTNEQISSRDTDKQWMLPVFTPHRQDPSNLYSLVGKVANTVKKTNNTTTSNNNNNNNHQQRTSTPTIPRSVTEYADITLLWNKDRDVLANRPDITVKNKDDRICLLIDVGIPLNMDVMQKDVEKRIQYKI